MKRETIKSLYMDPAAFAGREITVCGWARTIRDMKSFGFLELNDGSCFKGLQVVFAADTVGNYAEVAKQNVGAAFIGPRSLTVRVLSGGNSGSVLYCRR